jgi:hypothetical protein
MYKKLPEILEERKGLGRNRSRIKMVLKEMGF